MIEFNDITKFFISGTVRTDVLRGVTFKVNKGEFAAIMAPSGTGKTTLLNVLGCLMKASSGSYLFEDQDIETLNDDQLSEIRNKKIGFVFQTFNLLERTSALDNVLLPLVYADVYPADADKKASRFLESVGLKERINYKPSELSGGQQQRVAIARALINDPAVILADEPTGNLDANSAKEIMEIFKTLHKEGRTILVVTHDINIARSAERIIYLKDGRVEKEEVLR
ncbi:MAG: macrolide ABC transporter ATP-binding protein [Omnitrophica bacterium RIFCSPLOWO2_12_FULL_44_17]|uniref:Macrolide ABC transporter ATP-binding protein n=1 Tax=Candidatus Danuiimicrobium aquiferis TaxID=1801832 RepID=A0A1G1KYV2_9BACT|nr:MAG: macrolide ABC transporter ATP-binding protein [Omnitrophica bacterium RIFCSPHIGHO2_02_FULL_45_28]OGW98084.1 MAG: macrolide ABC transporter ATP-binding protein [Omnitrophica bacterium RIFCSPLOWO2_12_FULL_44_17]OGX03474.1 MAG: macrolide ABC transporter ATP-binding protein [Omnitrophica bacterium RIFCSPLOWO2_02_FULL_44_11]